jgi:hypothetical protein
VLQTVRDYLRWHSQEFYPFYLAEHQNPQSRKRHYIGTGIGLAGAALATFTGSLPLLVIGAAAAYGLAFSGHAQFENNKPATFKMPFASLLADVRMLGSYLNGTIEEKMLQYGLDSSGAKPVLRSVLPFGAWRYASVIQPDRLDGLRVQPQRGETFGGEFFAKFNDVKLPDFKLKGLFNKSAPPAAPAPAQPQQAPAEEKARAQQPPAPPAPQA